MYYIVCYDIADNKRRYRLSKYLSLYGVRVQESVFEIYIRREVELTRLKKQMRRCITDEDSVRLYYFPETARLRSRVIGSPNQWPLAHFPAVMVL